MECYTCTTAASRMATSSQKTSWSSVEQTRDGWSPTLALRQVRQLAVALPIVCRTIRENLAFFDDYIENESFGAQFLFWPVCLLRGKG